MCTSSFLPLSLREGTGGEATAAISVTHVTAAAHAVTSGALTPAAASIAVTVRAYELCGDGGVHANHLRGTVVAEGVATTRHAIRGCILMVPGSSSSNGGSSNSTGRSSRSSSSCSSLRSSGFAVVAAGENASRRLSRKGDGGSTVAGRGGRGVREGGLDVQVGNVCGVSGEGAVVGEGLMMRRGGRAGQHRESEGGGWGAREGEGRTGGG